MSPSQPDSLLMTRWPVNTSRGLSSEETLEVRIIININTTVIVSVFFLLVIFFKSSTVSSQHLWSLYFHFTIDCIDNDTWLYLCVYVWPLSRVTVYWRVCRVLRCSCDHLSARDNSIIITNQLPSDNYTQRNLLFNTRNQ